MAREQRNSAKGKKNDVPKDIAEMIIESVNSCGKVEEWKYESYYKRYRIKTNDIDFDVEKETYSRGGILFPFPDRKTYRVRICSVEYEGSNAHMIYDCVKENYEEKYAKIEEQKRKEREETLRTASETALREKMKSVEEGMRKKLTDK